MNKHTITITEVDYYYAEVVRWDGKECKASWGFRVKKEGRDTFTVKLANELIDFANKTYKEKFGKEVDFNSVKLDMTNYVEDTESILDDGVSYPRHVLGKKKVGKYDKQKNILRIFEDDVPVYENNNGKICSDSDALADSLM